MAEGRLALLGPVRVERDGEPVRGFESRKALALACLLATEGEVVTRERLVDLFWPELDLTRGRGNLSRVLNNLHAVLPGALSADRHAVAFRHGAGYWVDIWALDDLAARGRVEDLAAAAALWRGELLADLALDGCPEFDAWLGARRQAWSERVAGVLEVLLARHQADGEPTAALAAARQLLAVQPWRESAHRATMRCLAALGQRSAALEQFEACRRTLSDAFGVAPDEETAALRQAILDGAILASPAARHTRHNLVLPLTSFVGRERERGLVAERLGRADGRLVALIGPGGMGKSRLALVVAREALARFPDGVYWVELAGLHDAGLVPAAIAAAMGLTLLGREPALAQVERHLRRGRVLLVLDNLEHLLAATGDLLGLLAAAPGLALLVTTRERLNVQAEWVVPVSGLEVPPVRGGADIAHFAAVRLFVERAERLVQRVDLQGADAEAIARLCRLVDGVPLAIELAAAQLAERDCPAIAAGIAANLDGLATDLGDVPARHRSLRAVFDDSWAGLGTRQRAAFCRLCVFRGGFDAPAAAAVAGADAALLTDLAARSFVRGVPGERWAIHETLRGFGLERLTTEDTTGAAALRRARRDHAHWCRTVVRGDPAETAEVAGLVRRLAAEHDNLRAALAWCAGADGDVALGLAIAAEAFPFWHRQGHLAEGRLWLGRLLAAAGPDVPRDVIAKARSAAGVLAYLQGDLVQAQALQTAGLADWQAVADDLGIARAENNLGLIALAQDDYPAAEASFRRSLDRMERLGDDAGCANARLNLGYVAFFHEDYPAARADIEAALAIWQAADNAIGQARALGALGDVARAAGDRPAASVLFEASVAAWRRTDDRQGTARGLNDLGRVAFDAGDLDAARGWFEQSLAIRRELGLRGDMGGSYSNLGVVAERSGDLAVAERHFGAALEIWRELGDRHGTAHALLHLGQAARARGDPVASGAHFRDSLAAYDELGQKRGALQALTGLAGALADQGQSVAAARLLAAATALAGTLSPAGDDAVAERASLADGLRAELGELAFAAAWAAGGGLNWPEVVAEALAG